jgi:hypothetical protein
VTHPSAPQRRPVDGQELDGLPDLTVTDQAAIEAIRHQLEEEYPAPDEPARVDTGPAAPVRRGRSRAAWSPPLVATLVMLSGVGGGVVGAVVALQLLRAPEVEAPGAIAASPAGMTAAPDAPPLMPEPAISGTTSVDPDPSVAGRRPASVAAVRATPDLPPRADRAGTSPRPPLRRQVSGAPPPVGMPTPPAPANGPPRPAPAPPPAPLAVRGAPAPADGVPPPASGGADGLPAPVRLIPAPVPALPPTPPDGAPAPARVPTSGAPPRPPVPATGVLPAASVGADAKSSPAPESDVAPGSVVSVSLGTPRDTSGGVSHPTPAPPAAEPPSAPRRTLRESLRQDWNAAKRGLESAPADLERAWRSFTRDVKDLFDR